MRATLLCVLASLWVVAGQIGRAPAASGEDLLKFVIEQNRSAQEKIQTSSYGVELEWQDDTGKDSPVLKGTGEVKRKGNNLWSIYQRTGLNTTAGKIEQREMRMVVNGKYTASWPRKGNPLAYRDDHSSFETIDPRIETRIKLHTPYDFIPYAFGEGVRPFRESVSMDPATKWDAIETKGADGQAVYQIRRFMPTMDDASKPDAVWVVDPRKGFLATDLIAYKQNGDVWIHRSMEIKEVGERIWFPAEYDEKRYGEGREASPAHTVTSWRKAKLKDVKVNEAMAEEQFEIGSLRLREDKADIVVLRTGLDGTTVPYVYSGKGLVPQQVKEVGDHAVEKSIRTMGATAIDPGRRGGVPTPPAVPDAGRPQEVLGESAPNPGTNITQWLYVVGMAAGLIMLAMVVLGLRARRLSVRESALGGSHNKG